MGIAEARETIKACKHCFMCRYTCPTFLGTKLESVTPRGYGILLSELDQGCREWTRDIVDRFYQCTLCGLGREDCAFHWAEDEMVRQGREEIVKQRQEPQRVKSLATSLIKNGALSSQLPSWDLPVEVIGKKKSEVLYYAGASVRQHRPEIVTSVAKVLDAADIDWGVLEEEDTCGTELYELGYTEEARKKAGVCATKIAQAQPRVLLVSSPHHFRTIKEFYPTLGIELPADLKVMHTSQYFSELVARGTVKPNKRTAGEIIRYHDPCQLGRKMGEFEAPRRLIRAVTGKEPGELFHSREKAECCGAGSTMLLTNPEVAMKVAKLRLQGAMEDKTDLLVTACEQCKTLFARTATRCKLEIRILELSELLAESL